MKSRVIIAFLLLLCPLFTLLCGCSGLAKTFRAVAPAATIQTPSGAVLTQKGEAAQPATVTTSAANQSLTLPAGSVVWQDAKSGALAYQLSKDSVLTSSAKAEHVEAPRAFSPPAPPSPAEISDAGSRRMFWAGLVLGVAAALFGLVRDWPFVMLGGSVTAAACGVAIFVQTSPLIFALIGIGVLLKVLGPVLWHWKLKAVEPAPAA